MKKILLTLVALLSLTSVSAQEKFKAQGESRSYPNTYSWGKGGRAKAMIGYSKGFIGDITATVLSDRSIEVKNNTGLYFVVSVWVNGYKKGDNINDLEDNSSQGSFYTDYIAPWGTWKTESNYFDSNHCALMPFKIRVSKWKRK